MIHELKVHEPYFSQIRTGRMTCDLRRNDRVFSPNDIAVLKRCKAGVFTGEVCSRRIIFVITDRGYCPKGYVLLGLSEYGATEIVRDGKFQQALEAVFAPKSCYGNEVPSA